MSQSQPSTRRLGRRISWETILALLVLIAVIGGTLLNKDFLTVDNWSNLLANFVEIALMALPLSLVVITGEIDLSVASMLGLSSSLLGLLWEYKLPMPLAIVICLLVGVICGALNGFLIVRFHLPSLAVTIGTLALYRGFAYIVLGDKAVADYPPEYAEFGIGNIPYTFIPLPFVLFIVLAQPPPVRCLAAPSNAPDRFHQDIALLHPVVIIIHQNTCHLPTDARRDEG